MPHSEHTLVNFSEDQELDYILKKHGHSQTKENRERLVALGEKIKKDLNKTRLTHKELYNHMADF